MAGRVAVDTSVAVALLETEAEAVAHWLVADQVLLPAPVLAELLYGALNSAHPEAYQLRVRNLASQLRFCRVNTSVRNTFAATRGALKRAGRPIPVNDICIAAITIEDGATLASRDALFDTVPGLVRDAWC